jgi:hypothetical protein
MLRTYILGDELNVTVLDVLRGSPAYELAKSEMGRFFFIEPIAGQEYIAINVRLAVSKANPNEIYSLYPYWHLTLRYEDGGTDTWSQNATELLEGYPPLAAPFWIYFLVRENSSPVLYFQPNLIVEEQIGSRTSGAYLSIE